jgi:hypothetical protein
MHGSWFPHGQPEELIDVFPMGGANGASVVLRSHRFTKKWRSLNGCATAGANNPGDLLGAA